MTQPLARPDAAPAPDASMLAAASPGARPDDGSTRGSTHGGRTESGRPGGTPPGRSGDAGRYARGLAVLARVGGPGHAGPVDALRAVAPDLARWTVEFAFGDVVARPGLDLATRELCTVAALAAMGTAPGQLRFHLGGALNVGWQPADVVEVLLLTAVYAGFPAALNGVAALRDVLAQRDPAAAAAPAPSGATGADAADAADSGDTRYARGLATLERVSQGAGVAVVASLRDVAPELGRFVVEFAYGDVIGRPGLDDRTTELATVAMCTALGRVEPQLRVHVHAALNVGATRPEVVEVVQQMAVYAGFPAALNGAAAARAVFDERDAAPAAPRAGG